MRSWRSLFIASAARPCGLTWLTIMNSRRARYCDQRVLGLQGAAHGHGVHPVPAPAMWSMTGNSRALRACGGWRVLPTASGARLVMRVEMEPHGPLKLLAPLLRRREQPIFEGDLHNIKARLEETQPGACLSCFFASISPRYRFVEKVTLPPWTGTSSIQVWPAGTSSF